MGPDAMAGDADLTLERMPDATLVVRLAGPWRLRGGLPPVAAVERQLAIAPTPRRVSFDARALGDWDSALLAFLTHVSALCQARGIATDRESLPAGIRRLLALAEAVPEKKDARDDRAAPAVLERVGEATLAVGTASHL